jgi:hypothetical protein
MKQIRKLVKQNYLEYFLVSVIIILSFILRLYKINNPIADWHAWRQVDTASVTKNYLKTGLNLLQPRYHDVSAIQTGYFNPKGLRYVEFPIFNAFHFYLFKAFPQVGFDPAGRLTSILAFMSSLIPMYFLGKKYAGKWGGLFSLLVYGFMPYNVYFTRVVLPDGLAVALGVWAVWIFDLYIEKEKNLLLYLSSAIFSLAILAKPFGIFYGVVMIYLVLQKYGIKKSLTRIPLYIALDIILIPFFVWRGFLNKPPQIYGVAKLSWAFNGDHIRFKPSFWRWIFGERIGTMMLGGWGLIPFGIGVMNNGKKKYFLNTFMIGVILYVIVIATANVRHDYYQLFLVPPISLLTAKGFCEIFNRKTYSAVIVGIFCLFMMFGSGLYVIRGNYAINHPEIITAGKRMYELSNEGDLVVAPYNGDTTFLYQTGRWGWPVIDTSIDQIIKEGADYYVSVDVNSSDSVNFAKRFETVEKTDSYIILDLHKELGTI